MNRRTGILYSLHMDKCRFLKGVSLSGNAGDVIASN